MKILVTGAAGFIGFHISKVLIKNGHEVIGLDNINGYYDVKLKYARLEQLGISQLEASNFNIVSKSNAYPNFSFIRMNLEDRQHLPKLFRKQKIDTVCNLAAQAGVRFSIENPEPYIDSNIVGFSNILECSKNYNVAKFIYASSSSVYGMAKVSPFTETQATESPISLYAASKKANELLAHTYAHLFNMQTIGLRFFTVYGPWGRPDMALYKFTDAICNNKPIQVYNHGKMKRDFTFIDDLTLAMEQIILSKNKLPNHSIFNLGSNRPIALTDFISAIELILEKKAEANYLPLQDGDVIETFADCTKFNTEFKPVKITTLKDGVKEFVDWYKQYHLNNII